MTPQPTAKTVCGIAKETAKGTPVDASFFFPVDKLETEDKITYLDDVGYRGAMSGGPFNVIKGVTSGEVSIGGPLFTDAIGFVLQSLFGEEAHAGTTPSITHTFTLNNTGAGQTQPYTLTEAWTGHTSAREWPAATCQEFTFRWNADGLLEYDASFLTEASVLDVTAPSPSYTDVVPIAAYVPTVTVGGGGLATVENGEVSIKRNVTLVNTSDGAADPYSIFSGNLMSNGKFTCVAEDETELLRYLNNTQPSVTLAFADGVSSAFTYTASQVAYKTGKIVRGSEYVQVEVEWDAVANTTDIGASGGYGPCQVDLLNDIADTVYA